MVDLFLGNDDMHACRAAFIISMRQCMTNDDIHDMHDVIHDLICQLSLSNGEFQDALRLSRD